jgi:uncharacterized repeat protein (TIGR03803 family)
LTFNLEGSNTMSQQSPEHNFPANLCAATTALAFAFALTFATIPAAQAQTYTVLHNFTNGADGEYPTGSLVMDAAGNLYGIASGGVFKLAHNGGGWILSRLYTFQGVLLGDGQNPTGVIVGPDGSLYGTTANGGLSGSPCPAQGCGTVFRLTPPATFCKAVFCPWTETVLYRFAGSPDGSEPGIQLLVFDSAGNLYGTTFVGGSTGNGTVWELTPSNGTWTERILYSFAGGSDAAQPFSGVIFDSAGDLYGGSDYGGTYGLGAIYRLTPSGSGWTETVLHSFQLTEGKYPQSGLIFDKVGNLYGGTLRGGPHNGGTVFQLTPSNGGWTFSLPFSFQGTGGPLCSLVVDAEGNLYGTTNGDGYYGRGSIFKLTPGSGGWTYTSLHDFTGGGDGGDPWGNSVGFDANGNFYGTTVEGGAYGAGVVWEVTP